MRIEQLIFSHLIYDEDYGRKVIPFLKEDYFHDQDERLVFNIVNDYVAKYNAFPTKEALAIEISTRDGLRQETVDNVSNMISALEIDPKTKPEWLLDQTETFCQDKAIYNSLMQAIQILDDKQGSISKGSIPKIMSDALGVSFDTHIGHDFLEQWEERYDSYHLKEERIPFDLDLMNKITGGGLPSKTLNIILAGTGVGKSLFMCHCAASNLAMGKNVLYITLEMAEERIAQRIDANLLNVPMDALAALPKDLYEKKIQKIQQKCKGKLIVKEYPTASAGSANFRHLLNELRLKKNFVPDIIYIDYLNICMSSRIKFGQNVNSYTYVKAIAEELRGLAVEFDVPIMSATQTTRSGFTSSDPGLEDTSESFGLPATADLMFALTASDELKELNQVAVKQLKNRYTDPDTFKRFVLGIDKPRMKLYDTEQSSQNDLIGGPVMDKTKFGEEDSERSKKGKKFDKSLFQGFK